MKKPQYKDKKFINKEEFNIWLKNLTETKIVFEDDGQDFLEWFVDKNGEVLHSDLQAFVWNGKMVDLTKIRIGQYLPLQDKTVIIHRVKKIIKYTPSEKLSN